MSAVEGKFYEATVVGRQDFSEDLWSLRLDPGGEFRYQAGQYATLGMVTPAGHIERAYSIASSPYEPHLEFFFERVPHGELTPLLYGLQVGDTLTCRKIAKGRFTLDTRGECKNHLLLATVTGVAPFVSYVRTLYGQWNEKHENPGHNLFIIEGASHSSEFGYAEELTRYASEVPWLKFVATVSRPWEDATWAGERGRADDLIRKYADSWGLTPATTLIYLCGHPTMIENGKGILLRGGWQKSAMKEEVYFIPKKKTGEPTEEQLSTVATL
jgi:ferredoxin--NADP+ reductase